MHDRKIQRVIGVLFTPQIPKLAGYVKPRGIPPHISMMCGEAA